MMPQTEFPFSLPFGYTDSAGQVHQDGTMRLATAYDEIAPLKDPRVQVNTGYLIVILLARVVTRLGDLTDINPKVIESLYAGDLAYLQDLYRRINNVGHNRLAVTCPQCEQGFEVEVGNVGE